ncbi:hypothetical protein A2U01_0084656, partial [Trifolium medium]|nr:hypothetical protein [Trifolium medium]
GGKPPPLFQRNWEEDLKLERASPRKRPRILNILEDQRD